MDTFLTVVILALAVNLMANMIWKYLPHTDNHVDVWVTMILIIVCVLIIVSRKEATQVSPVSQSPSFQQPSYEIKTYNDVYLEGKIGEAKESVFAVGTYLTAVPSNRLEDLIRKLNVDSYFRVELVLRNPDSEMLKQRIKDEKGSKYKESDYQELKARIDKKLLDFNILLVKLNPEAKKRLILRCIDTYPTVSVYIIDDDLYTYSYTHGEIPIGNTAVIIFRKYKDNPLADFFVRHLESTINAAKDVTDGKCK